MTPRKTIDVDPQTYMKNTVRLPYSDEAPGGLADRFGFFTCFWCDIEKGGKAGQTGMLLQADISHYCDDCGGPLVLWVRI